MAALSPNRIVSWVSALGNRYRERQLHEQELRAETDLVVDVADRAIRQVGRYQKDLRQAMTAAMGYCNTLVEEIPGPVRLSRQQYHADPLVKAVFVSDKQMLDLLRSAVAGQSAGEWDKGGEGVALLTMTRTERTIFGHEEHQGMILGDVAKRTVNFVDHRIVAFSPLLATTKEKLRHRALEVLAMVAMEKIHTIRGKIAELREQKAHLQSMHTILKRQNRTMDMFANPSFETTQKINKIKQKLVTVKGELAAERSRLATPADSLALLAEILSSPAEVLVMAEKMLRVDWMNVLLDDRADGDGNEIRLAEFSVGEEFQRWAVLVSFRFEDVIEA